MTLLIRYGANFKVVGKTDPQKLSYPGAFTPTQGTITDLADHISKGHPWMPALLDEGKPRWQQYANVADLAALDIDGGMTTAEANAQPLITAWCCLGIESASSSPELEKFRLVFRYHAEGRKPQGYQEIRICNRYLMEQIKVADKACKDASRFFFGARGRSPFLLNESATLPVDFVDQALAWNQEQERRAEQQAQLAQQRWQQWQAENPERDEKALILEALSFISPDCEYTEWLSIGMTLFALFGSEGVSIWDGWSAGSSKHKTGECDRKARTFRNVEPRIGQLFNLAKSEGFRFPELQKASWQNPLEPNQQQYQQFIEQESEQQQIQDAQQQESVFASLKKALAKASRKLRRPRGFFAPQVTEQIDDLLEYEKGQRLAVWRSLLSPHQIIQDLSSTGSGKSFDSGNARPEDFGAKQLFYVTDQVRNPTVFSLSDENGWRGVEGRHGGLKVDDSGKLRVAKSGDKADVPGNCARTSAISALRAKNIFGADTDVACLTCPLQKACKHFTGDGYGFKWQRKVALPHDRVRIHPASLPEPTDYDYSEVIIILDEAQQNLINLKEIEVRDCDIAQLTTKLALGNPELFSQLQPLLAALQSTMKQKTRFGLTLSEIKQALPGVPANIDYEALHQALAPDLSVLESFDEIAPPELDLDSLKDEYKRDLMELEQQQAVELSSIVLSKDDKEQIRTEFKKRKSALKRAFDDQVKNLKAEHRKELRRIDKMLRMHTAQSSQEAEKQIEQAVLKQWLPEFLEILQGHRGFARSHHGKLILTLPDKRMVNVLKACKGVVILDATLSKEDLALKLECNSDQIPVIRQEQEETPNLKLTQVTDLGQMGMQRGQEQQRRLKEIVNHYQQLDPTTKVIDYKKFDGDGAWWRDSRGVNDFTEVKTLILVGTPCPNINALLAEYAVLTGCSDTENEGFKAFVDRRIRADIMQAIGRPRANRRLDEQLNVILVSDFDLGLPHAEQVKASSIVEAAADKFERFQMVSTRTIAQLKEAGQKVTQTAVAAITGYSQQYISRHWKLLQMLLENLYSKSGKKSGAPPDDGAEPIIDATTTALELVTADLSPSELPECIEDLFFESLTSDYWGAVLARVSDRAKFALLECLLPLCSVQTLEELGTLAS